MLLTSHAMPLDRSMPQASSASSHRSKRVTSVRFSGSTYRSAGLSSADLAVGAAAAASTSAPHSAHVFASVLFVAPQWPHVLPASPAGMLILSENNLDPAIQAARAGCRKVPGVASCLRKSMRV